MKNKINFWGVEIEKNSREDVLKKVNEMLNSNGGNGFIVTLNPEILLKAKEDEKYGKILNKANLKIIDGFGIKLASFLKRRGLGDRIPGADLAQCLLGQARRLNLRLGFVMNKDGLSNDEELKEKMEEWGVENFFIEKADVSRFNNENFEELISGIKKADILLVGLGAPFQEKFIWEIKDQLPNLKLAMGVGGTFDFWTGKQKRAPRFMRNIGMEWLWRLFRQPKRLGRIWKATVVFGWKGLFRNCSN